MYEGSPLRLAVAGLFLAVLAGALVWTLWSARDTGAGGPAAPPLASAEEPVLPSPPAEPADADEPVGPATGDYAELATAAELEHPDTDPHIRRWYDWFEAIDGPWSNRAELWDSVTEGLREEATSLGRPFDHPTFDGDTAQPALVAVIWAVTHPRGSGDVALVKATYRRDHRVTNRVWGVLIGRDPERKGHVMARMEPFDLFVTDYQSFQEFQKAGDSRVWEWVVAQGAEKADLETDE